MGALEPALAVSKSRLSASRAQGGAGARAGAPAGARPRQHAETPDVASLPICGRVLIGRGSDVYDPLCERLSGHGGRCMTGGEVDAMGVCIIRGSAVLRDRADDVIAEIQKILER